MKKNKKQPVQTQSPITYIKTKLSTLPMECFKSKGNKENEGFVTILVVRKMPSEKYCVATFLLDVYCLGIKNTGYRFALSESELKEFAMNIGTTVGELEPVANETAHNYIYGALDYAEELGFKPDKDWAITEYFLNPDLVTDAIDRIEFGQNGKPFYISGPYDNVNVIINTLRRTVGDGNFDFIAPIF